MFSDLDFLVYLSVVCDSCTGRIPRELGALTKLETLWLGSNKLTGVTTERIDRIRRKDVAHSRGGGTRSPEIGNSE